MARYLIKGDVSGIQEFIFNVPSKGAARELKARSFYVSLITTLAVEYILDEINCINPDERNKRLFFNGGGNFFLLLEEPEFSQDVMIRWQSFFDAELINDEISLILSYVKLSEDGFSEDWRQLRLEGNRNKLTPLSTQFDQLFTPYNDGHADGNGSTGHWKRTVAFLSKSLTQKNSFKEMESGASLFGRDVAAYLTENNMLEGIFLPQWDQPLMEAVEAHKADNPKPEARDTNKEIEPKEGNVIDFGHLAEFAQWRTGTDLIGVLKMDIDDLSRLFGTEKSETEFALLSEQLQMFFEREIKRLLSEEASDLFGETIEFKHNIYPVFVGGDDCFFIGAWDAILAFASQMNSAFRVFAESLVNDPSFKSVTEPLTLSAGIILIDHQNSDFSSKDGKGGHRTVLMVNVDNFGKGGVNQIKINCGVVDNNGL